MHMNAYPVSSTAFTSNSRVVLKRPRIRSDLPPSAMARKKRWLFSCSFIDDTPFTSVDSRIWLRCWNPQSQHMTSLLRSPPIVSANLPVQGPGLLAPGLQYHCFGRVFENLGSCISRGHDPRFQKSGSLNFWK